MLRHEFTLREKILILICIVLALGIFYYEIAWKGLANTISTYNTDNLSTELTLAQTKAMQEANMKKAIEENQGKNFGEVAVYNNLANEVSEMGNILNGRAQDISISWSEPTLTDTTVRRVASVSFEAGSYQTAKTLISDIANARYRSVISDVTISGDEDTLNTSSSISVSCTVTFFETINGAASTQGLVVIEDSTSTTDSTSTAQ